MLISSGGLGAVEFGSTFAQARQVSGVALYLRSTQACESGRLDAPGGGTTLWMQATPSNIGVLFAVSESAKPRQQITTSEGITLGWSTLADLRRAYPGLKPGSGYEGNQKTVNFTATDKYSGILYFDLGPPADGATFVQVIATGGQQPHHMCGGA